MRDYDYSRELAARIEALLPQTSRIETVIPDLAITRFDDKTSSMNCFYRPMVALVVQGCKRSIIGDYEINYGQNQYAVVGMDAPGSYHITEASAQKPFLSLAVKFNKQIISQLINEMPELVANKAKTKTGVMVAPASQEVLDVFLRLLDLAQHPSRMPVLAPMLLRELHFYLLESEQGSCLLRLLGSEYTTSIAQAIAWLRKNFSQSISMQDLASQVNMSPSVFYRHFRQMTGLSPLQFQKRLRLYEAERLMLLEGKDASTAALLVGYESGSQFTREYKRHFGSPPRQDVNQKSA